MSADLHSWSQHRTPRQTRRGRNASRTQSPVFRDVRSIVPSARGISAASPPVYRGDKQEETVMAMRRHRKSALIVVCTGVLVAAFSLGGISIASGQDDVPE